MNVSRVVRAGLLLAFAALGAPSMADAGEVATRKTLRAASLEAMPPAIGQPGRFRLSARLHSAPTAVTSAQAPGKKLTAVLVSKAVAATCPSPGSIFYDGYE